VGLEEAIVRTGKGPDALAWKIVSEFREAVLALRPDLGFRLTLFGSRARGDADEESDVDILVELDVEKADRGTHRVLSDVAADLSLRHSVVVSLIELDRERQRGREGFPFLRTIREEGVAA
jgi:predicted nucleotidyltransferase